MVKLKGILYFLVIAYMVGGCKGNTNPCGLSPEIIQDIDNLDSLIQIPEVRANLKSFITDPPKEPQLFNAENETYRLIVVGGYEDADVYRVEKSNEGYRVVLKEYEAKTYSLSVNQEFEIDKTQWNTILNGLNAFNFWTYTQQNNDERYLHAATWWLEGYKPIKDECTLRNYHMVAYTAPKDTTFLSMCKLFLNLKEK